MLDGQLNLNPGAPRRKSISGCKCLMLTIFIVILSCIGLFFIALFVETLKNFLIPHSAFYHNTTLADVSNRALVVQPLITRQQTFDIAATVWLRTTEKGGHRDRGEAKEGEPEDLEEEQLVERPLYSDIVFQGLHLTDKNVFSTVNFTVPTAIFRNANLTNYDLRGSIVLLPTSSSLLGQIANYSTWIPDTVNVLPVRTWPFPLGSPNLGEKTLADRVVESFGASTPLLQFHGVKSQCHGSKNDYSTNSDEFIDDDEDETKIDVVPTIKNQTSSLEVTDSRPVLASHPYIVTRTQIRVVDETKLFNRKAFAKAHKQLKETSCGQKVLPRPNRYRCEKEYRKNGHWETLLQLRVVNESTGSPQTEWAYGPYISVSRFALGQMDLLPIPVNRENCSENASTIWAEDTSNVVPEQDTIDVAWKISYSGRTPGKLGIAEMGKKYKWYAFNETESARIAAHDSAMLANGIAGHRFGEDVHPRRRFSMMVVRSVLAVITVILDIRYWFTRKSTASITILGTTLISSAQIFRQLTSTIIKGMEDKFTLPGWIGALLSLTITSLVLPLLMIKAIARIEFKWWKDTTWIPAIQIADATRAERASERLDAQISWHAKVGLFLSITVIYYFFALNQYHVIPAIVPDPKINDGTRSLPPAIFTSMIITGNILQLILNWKSQKYAGNYRLCAIFLFIMELLSLAEFVPAWVGKFEARRSLSAHELLKTSLLLVAAWEAMALPSVPQMLEDDHVD